MWGDWEQKVRKQWVPFPSGWKSPGTRYQILFGRHEGMEACFRHGPSFHQMCGLGKVKMHFFFIIPFGTG